MPARLRWSSSASPMLRSGCGGDPAYRLVEVPVRAEQVGSEVADDAVLVRGRHQLDHRQPVADAPVLRGGQHRPDLELRAAGPPPAGRVDPPGAVHPEVGVQGEVVGEAGTAGACPGRPPRVRRRRSGRWWPAPAPGTPSGSASRPASTSFSRWQARQTVSPSGTRSLFCPLGPGHASQAVRPPNARIITVTQVRNGRQVSVISASFGVAQLVIDSVRLPGSPPASGPPPVPARRRGRRRG